MKQTICDGCGKIHRWRDLLSWRSANKYDLCSKCFLEYKTHCAIWFKNKSKGKIELNLDGKKRERDWMVEDWETDRINFKNPRVGAEVTITERRREK